MSIKTLVHSVTIVLALAIVVLAGSAFGQPLQCNQTITGCFDVTVIGPSAQAQIVGFARSFGSAGHKKWYTHLVTSGGASSFTLQYSGHALPPEGEHLIVNNHATEGDPPFGKFIGAGLVDPTLGVPEGFHSVKGKILITVSTADWVEGTFNFKGLKASTGQGVTVKGAFRSQNTVQ